MLGCLPYYSKPRFISHAWCWNGACFHQCPRPSSSSTCFLFFPQTLASSPCCVAVVCEAISLPRGSVQFLLMLDMSAKLVSGNLCFPPSHSLCKLYYLSKLNSTILGSHSGTPNVHQSESCFQSMVYLRHAAGIPDPLCLWVLPHLDCLIPLLICKYLFWEVILQGVEGTFWWFLARWDSLFMWVPEDAMLLKSLV